MELSVCHLYPDVLSLYGDRGNIVCLESRMRWRGHTLRVAELPIGETAPFGDFDLFFIGGGQDFEQESLLQDLNTSGKAADIRAAVEDGKPFLAICGGYQLLGQYYETWDGRRCDFTGALDFYTLGAKDRMVGNFAFTCDEADGGTTVVGFENHSGRTWLGEGVRPLGRVLRGFGNNGCDQSEGARYKNVFCSYSHGPLLPKNPALADRILETALARKYGEAKLEPLDDAFECRAHESAMRITMK